MKCQCQGHAEHTDCDCCPYFQECITDEDNK